MPKNLSAPIVKLSIAKAIHDIASPLGALVLFVDDIKKALPDSAEIIETSIDGLSHKLQFWRALLTGSDNNPNFADAYKLISDMCKNKNIKLNSLAIVNDYNANYVRLIMLICLVLIEGLPRGGKINIDDENGEITAESERCYLSKEFQEGFFENLPELTSRHITPVLIKEWANILGAKIELDHSSTHVKFCILKK